MERQAPAWLNRHGAKLGLGVPSCPCWQTQSADGGFKRKLAGLWLLALVLPPGFAGAAPFAYISNQNSNTVSVIDTASNTVVATVPVGTDPWGVAVNPTGTRAYVANANSNTVSVIDTASNSVVATVPVDTYPVGVSVNPAGSRAYVANYWSDSVSVIDTVSNSVVATVPVGTHPLGVAMNPSGTRAYISNGTSNSVSVIDTASNSVVATVPVGAHPAGVIVNPSGSRVYVANFSPSLVSVIDTASNSVVATVPAGTNPWGVAMNPAGTRAYVTNFGSDSVSVIDTASNAVVATVPVGSGPRAFGQFIGPSQIGQTLNFGTLPDRKLGDLPFSLSASASSGLLMAFSSLTPSVCAVNGNTVTLLAAGSCTLAANQSGDANFAAAPPVTQTFTIAKGNQTLTFGAAPNVSVGGTGAVSATNTSGLTVSFTSTTPVVCTVSGSTVTGVTAGSCTIAANQIGDGNYTRLWPFFEAERSFS